MASVAQITEQINDIQDEIDSKQSKVDALNKKIAAAASAKSKYHNLLKRDCGNRRHDSMLPKNKKACWDKKQEWRDSYNAASTNWNTLVGSQRTPLLNDIKDLKDQIDNLVEQKSSQQAQEEKTSHDVSIALANQGKTLDAVNKSAKITANAQANAIEDTAKTRAKSDMQVSLLKAQTDSSNKKRLGMIGVGVGIVVIIIAGIFIYKKVKKMKKNKK